MLKKLNVLKVLADSRTLHGLIASFAFTVFTRRGHVSSSCVCLCRLLILKLLERNHQEFFDVC